MSNFKKEHTEEKRRAEAKRILIKYPDRVPVIAEVHEDADLPPLDRQKYLVPCDLTAGQFTAIIRARIKLAPEEALYLFMAGKVLPPMSQLMSQVYKDNKDEDGFLYVLVNGEATFG